MTIQERSHAPQAPGSNPDPSSPDHAPSLDTEQARSGVTLGRMRWVLRISMVAVVIALAIVWAVAAHR